jgi:hypothetical protein
VQALPLGETRLGCASRSVPVPGNRQPAEVGLSGLSAYRSFVISALAALGTLDAVDFDGMG